MRRRRFHLLTGTLRPAVTCGNPEAPPGEPDAASTATIPLADLDKRVPYVVTEHAVVLAGVEERGVVYADPLQSKRQRVSFQAGVAGFGEIDDPAVVLRP